ncbi:MAG: hypothetical protein JW759_07030 [Candidatus Coatesbacteria bacterium]|nr:hypothetical protein [Candidatus Coatesbacteria bacterium]
MKCRTVFLLCAAFLVTVGVVSWATLSPNSGGQSQTAPLAQAPNVQADQEDPGVLGYDNCLKDCDVMGIGKDPEATGSCLYLFHVFHLNQNLQDPDCCNHLAPSTVDFYIAPWGGTENKYTLVGTGPLWWEDYSCYVYNYVKTLSLQNHQWYCYRFDHPGTDPACKCPSTVPDSVYVDCDE